MTSTDPAALRDLALDVAREAVALVRGMRAGGIGVADTKSSTTDVVTAADEASEVLIRDRILRARPHDSIMGEEGDDHLGTSGVRWIVDPIDGTVNYLYGLPDCAVSIAAEHDGVVVAGVVAGIGRDVEYAAARGCGATRDGHPLQVRDTPPVAERLVMTGFGYRTDVRQHQAQCVAQLIPRVRDIRRNGSAALDLCFVAEGSADGYVEEGPHLWDVAAGALILREAGGRHEMLAGSMPETVPDAAVQALSVAAPIDGWDSFVALLDACGYLPGTDS